MAVRKAVLLAAGLGTRLRPLTLSRPKPLLPVMGEPMLGRALDMLVSWGVEEIRVNAHYMADQVERFVDEYRGGRDCRGISISVSREDAILGTGGALRPLAGWIGDDPFWLVNGDIVSEGLDPEPIEEAFERSGRFAACWISEDYGPRTVEADMEGRVCNWRSDDAGCDGTYTYCGVALLSPEVLRHLPAARAAEGGRGEGFCSIVEAYEAAMMGSAKFVVGVQQPEALWCDVGTVPAYREMNSEPMEPGLFCDRRLDGVVKALGCGGGALAEFLDARGSDRIFFRLYREGAPDALAVVYETTRRENARFAPITRFLSGRGVRVPALLADLPEERAYATEFVRGRSLNELAGEKGADLVRLYLPALDVLKSLWAISPDDPSIPDLEPGFDAALYAWEVGLFEDECVKGRLAMDGVPDAVRGEMALVAEELVREPAALVHRDFQSSNMIFPDGGGLPYLIDYQGMRSGAAAYDVASLLYDPYVAMSEADRETLLGVACAVPGAPSPRAVRLAAVQRLCQAIGAFCRLVKVGQGQFARHVPAALSNLHHAAHAAGLRAMAEFTHGLIEREGLRARRP